MSTIDGTIPYVDTAAGRAAGYTGLVDVKVPAHLLDLLTEEVAQDAKTFRLAGDLDAALKAAVLAGTSPAEYLARFLNQQHIPSMRDQAARLRATIAHADRGCDSGVVDADEASEPLVLETDGIQLADLGIPDCEAVTSSSEDAATSDCFELAML